MRYTEFDLSLISRVELRQSGQAPVKFQFPPKITSDSRKGEWKEGSLRGFEPVATFDKSGPREMTLTFTYIVDGWKWTTGVISDQVMDLRRYFARVRENKSDYRGLIVYFKMWYHGGTRAATCRFKGIDVKHSETIVAPVGFPERAYPLRTDVTLDLRLWAQGADVDGKQPTQNLSGLDKNTLPGWY